MENKGYSKFCSHLDEAVKAYPSLAIKEKNGTQYLKGILDVKNCQSTVVGSYLIEIHYPDNYPYRFPIFFEKGGDIPNENDWHKHSNGACCLTVLPDEILKCKHGINLVEFIGKYCLSFLANHIYFKENKSYLNGDYSHGLLGLKEFYTELFKKEEFSFWYECVSRAFGRTSEVLNRNSHCYCGSNLKFKHCHLRIIETLKEIGLGQIISDFKKVYPIQTAHKFKIYSEVFTNKF